MTEAPYRLCLAPSCPVLVRGGGRCPQHGGPRKPWHRSGETPKRVTGRPLQRLRAQLFARQPLCVVCLAAGRVRASEVRDHIVPLAEGGSDTEDNVRGICVDCHKVKTQQESQRGQARAR